MEKLVINDFCCLRYEIGESIIYSTPKKETYLLDGKCSKPYLSPYKDKLFYFYPYGENEKSTCLYLFDLESKERREIANADKYNSSPKKAFWLNNNEILVIIGLNCDVLKTGGDVYKYNIQDCDLSPYYICEKMQMVQDIFIENDNNVYLRGVTFENDFEIETSHPFTLLLEKNAS